MSKTGETLSVAHIRQGIARINEEARRIGEEEAQLYRERRENEESRARLQGLCAHESGKVRKNNNPYYECVDCGAELGRANSKW